MRTLGQVFLAVGLGACAGTPGPVDVAARQNVLLLCVDDLRPELACYGAQHMHTPHLDRLAEEGVLFTRHYVQVPTCGASRASMLTGRYPRSRRALGNGAFAALPRDSYAHLPGWFRHHGYRTISIGKVTHTPDGTRRGQNGKPDPQPELAKAWQSYGAPAGRWGDSWSAFFGYTNGKGRIKGKTPAFERGATDDTPDVLIASEAVETLHRLRGGVPFFLAVGFYKPHLPHNAPDKDFARYSLPALPRHGEPAVGTDPELTLHKSGELLRNYGGHPKGGLANEEYVRRLRRAYYACVTHVDEQIGRVLAALRETGLDQNTIVVVWGDHGYHLGDHGVWGKHTLFERALRSVLIVRAPEMNHGECATVVESLDLYPTLAALCRLPAPPDVDGKSLVPQLVFPGRTTPRRARSTFPRGKAIGRTVRTDRWRYTEWWRDGKVILHELYDHDKDPEESRNVYDQNVALAGGLAGSLGPLPVR